MIRNPIRKTAGAIAIAALLGGGACSDDGGQTVEALDPQAAIAALQQAPDAAAAAGSGRMEMVIALEAEGETFEVTAEGVFTGDQAQLVMDLGEQLARMAPGEELPPGFDEPMTIVVDGTTTYMKMPMLAAITGTDSWLSMSPEDMGLAEGMLPTGGASSNPAQMLETLRGVSNDFEDLGESEVRGEAVHGYRVTIDLDKAMAEVPEEHRDAFEQQVSELPVDALPMDVYLDADGLARRIEMDMGELMGQSGGAGHMTIDFFDYGADVAVEVPAAADVTPFSEVMGALGG